MVRRTGFLPGLTRTNTGSVRVRSGVGSGCGVAIFDADAPSVRGLVWVAVMGVCLWFENPIACLFELVVMPEIDRKSTRLNSRHVASSYAVFCLKKEGWPDAFMKLLWYEIIE